MWHPDSASKHALVTWSGSHEVSSICTDVWYSPLMSKTLRNFCACPVNNLLWSLGDHASERVGSEVAAGTQTTNKTIQN